jgi:hypothetical protein
MVVPEGRVRLQSRHFLNDADGWWYQWQESLNRTCRFLNERMRRWQPPFIGIPAIAAVGIAWVQLMDRQGAIRPRSPEAGGILVFVLALLPIFTLGTLWPLHLAFFATRPAFDHLADQIAAGKTVVFPQYAGWFKLNGAAVDPVSGAVGLLTEPDTSHPAGFVRVRPGSAASPNTPVHGSDLRVELGGKWSYRQDD